MKCPYSLFKKNEIVFHSKIHYGQNLYPIEEGSFQSREWYQHCLEWFKDFAKKAHPSAHLRSPHRCPGIKSIINTGFVIKAHRDIVIETNGDGQTIMFWDNTDLPAELQKDTGVFEPELFGDHLERAKPRGALRTLVKIDLPWLIEAPRDIVFLVTSVPYSDDDRFQIAPGLLDPLYALETNAVFWWMVKEGVETIKRGTPLIQLVPIKREKPYKSWRMQNITPDYQKKSDLATYALASTQIGNYNTLKIATEKTLYENSGNR